MRLLAIAVFFYSPVWYLFASVSSHSPPFASRWHQTGRIEPVIPRMMALSVLEEEDAKKVDVKLNHVDSEAEGDNQQVVSWVMAIANIALLTEYDVRIN